MPLNPHERPLHRREEVEGAFEQLLERYSFLLRALIVRHCPRNLGIQVGDVEQEARLRLWRALEREKNLTDPASYIYRIAVSTTIDAVRRVVARREDQLAMQESEEEKSMKPLAADPAQAPDAQAERREVMAKISAAVAALPENRRVAVELHLQGLTLSEISDLLGWSEGKARNLVYRGVADLRAALLREGIEYE